MMERKKKCQDHESLRQRTLDQILKLNFWPAECKVSLMLGRPGAWGRYKNGRLQKVNITVEPAWLESVYCNGLATVGRCLVLASRPQVIPPGCDSCRRLVVMDTSSHGRVRTQAIFLVEYGGLRKSGTTPEQAAEKAMSEYRNALLNPGGIQLPF
jgi:hypothetical protein